MQTSNLVLRKIISEKIDLNKMVNRCYFILTMLFIKAACIGGHCSSSVKIFYLVKISIFFIYFYIYPKQYKLSFRLKSSKENFKHNLYYCLDSEIIHYSFGFLATASIRHVDLCLEDSFAVFSVPFAPEVEHDTM